MPELLAQALQVTTFVGVMTIAVEYLGVSGRGAVWRRASVVVKAIDLGVGIAVGSVMMASGA